MEHFGELNALNSETKKHHSINVFAAVQVFVHYIHIKLVCIWVYEVGISIYQIKVANNEDLYINYFITHKDCVLRKVMYYCGMHAYTEGVN